MTPFDLGYAYTLKLAYNMAGPPQPGEGEKYMPWYLGAGTGVLGSAAGGKLPGKWKLPGKVLGAMLGTAVGVHGGEVFGRAMDGPQHTRYYR
jgi:hypothetical protein